jgi:hypothetical protein
MEEIMAFLEGLKEIIKTDDFSSGRFRQTVKPGIEIPSLFYVHGRVGTPCRQHCRRIAGGRVRNVMFQGIDRVVGGTEELNGRAPQQRKGAEISGSEKFIATVIYPVTLHPPGYSMSPKQRASSRHDQ